MTDERLDMATDPTTATDDEAEVSCASADQGTDSTEQRPTSNDLLDTEGEPATDIEKVAESEGGRFREIVRVLMDHGLIHGLTPEKLCAIFTDLGPTYVKIGQIMSMRPDMIPVEYCDELAKLRSEVTPMSYEEVREALRDSYGDQLRAIFDHIDRDPLGSGSIAQAHSAQLVDGRRVVLKIQRPGVYKKMAEDIALLRRATRLLKLAPNSVVGDVVDFQGFIDEMWMVAQEEMDFLVEAKHTDEFAEFNKDADRIEVPKIYHEYTASKVLMMEYIEGCSLEDPDRLTELGYDRDELGDLLLENYVKQITVDGFFHADPHPGNIWVRDGNIVWIDLGMTGRLSVRDRAAVNEAIVAVADGDVSRLKEVVLTLGIYDHPIDHSQLYSDIELFLNHYSSLEIGELNLAVILQELIGIAKKHGISMPSSVSILARGIATIEGTLSRLSPDVNMVDILKRQLFSSEIDSFDPLETASSFTRKLHRSANEAADIPGLTTDLMKMLMRGQFKMNIELSSSGGFDRSFRNAVGQIVVGLVIAAFLIGSSFICTTGMQPQVLGVPAVGFVGFLIAFVLGMWEILDMMRRR
jgi:ubiquinone biosynthesis protein